MNNLSINTTKKTVVLFLIISIAALLPLCSHADGLFVPSPTKRVYETQQEAVIFFEDEQEDLILTTSYEGDAEEFAWIVPTPSVPTIEKGSWEVFVALRELTSVTDSIQELAGYGEADTFDLKSSYLNESEVQEIERTTVGYYNIAVLDARTTEGLMDWFERNDFIYPERSTDVLDEYIDAGWYFSAISIDPDDVSISARTDISTGEMLPLHFQFKTDRVVFPLKLSQVGLYFEEPSNDKIDDSDWLLDPDEEYRIPAPELPTVFPTRELPITLYIIADTKKSLYGFDEKYAGWIAGDVVSELSFDTGGQPLIQADEDERYVLTKLSGNMRLNDMTYDLYPRDETNEGLLNDKEPISVKKIVTWTFIGLAIVVSLVLISMIVIMNKEPKNKLLK